MGINTQKVLVSFIVVTLITSITLGAASPVGISESVVVKAAKNGLELNQCTVAMIDRVLIALT